MMEFLIAHMSAHCVDSRRGLAPQACGPEMAMTEWVGMDWNGVSKGEEGVANASGMRGI